MAALANDALRRAPDATFFSGHTVNARLEICPTARLPIWYNLRVEFSGVAARTNANQGKPAS